MLFSDFRFLAVFFYYFKHIHEKKNPDFSFCFWIHDSRVIIENGSPSLESAVYISNGLHVDTTT